MKCSARIALKNGETMNPVEVFGTTLRLYKHLLDKNRLKSSQNVRSMRKANRIQIREVVKETVGDMCDAVSLTDTALVCCHFVR